MQSKKLRVRSRFTAVVAVVAMLATTAGIVLTALPAAAATSSRITASVPKIPRDVLV